MTKFTIQQSQSQVNQLSRLALLNPGKSAAFERLAHKVVARSENPTKVSVPVFGKPSPAQPAKPV